MKDRRAIIYKLVFPNGKLYIGQTIQSFKTRCNFHKYAAYNKHVKDYHYYIYKAIRKYGWDNIRKEIILICEVEDADYYEIELIKLYKTTIREFGYNLESGGNKNKIMSEDTKEKLRNAKLGTTQDIKQILSKSNPIIQYENDKLINIYISTKYIDQESTFNSRSVMRCLREKGLRHCGYNWKYYLGSKQLFLDLNKKVISPKEYELWKSQNSKLAKEKNSPPELKASPIKGSTQSIAHKLQISKPIECYKNNKLYKLYMSVEIAAKELKCAATSIRNYINEIYVGKEFKGFTWKYYEGDKNIFIEQDLEVIEV